MFNLQLKKPLTGLEITASSIKIAQVMREKKIWKLIRCEEVPLPKGVLNLSFSDRNILDVSLFHYTVDEALKLLGSKVGRAGLSLPNESIKLSIQKFDEIPQSRAKMEQLIGWREKDNLPFPVERALFSYFLVTGSYSEEKRFIVTVGSQEVVREYETGLREFQISPEIVRPSAINQLNFYMSRLPDTGTISFLGIFDSYYAFFVFQNGQLEFYRGKRRPFPLDRFIDVAMELYQTEYAGRSIETLYLGTYKEKLEDLERDIKEDFDLDFLMIDETGIIVSEIPDLSSFAAAIGAAQSLVS